MQIVQVAARGQKRDIDRFTHLISPVPSPRTASDSCHLRRYATRSTILLLMTRSASYASQWFKRHRHDVVSRARRRPGSRNSTRWPQFRTTYVRTDKQKRYNGDIYHNGSRERTGKRDERKLACERSKATNRTARRTRTELCSERQRRHTSHATPSPSCARWAYPAAGRQPSLSFSHHSATITQVRQVPSLERILRNMW